MVVRIRDVYVVVEYPELCVRDETLRIVLTVNVQMQQRQMYRITINMNQHE